MADEKIQLQTSTVKELLCKITLPECKKQLFGFVYVLRREMLAEGISDQVIRKVITNALEDYAPTCAANNVECVTRIEEAIENYINAPDKGQDILGRILAHYCYRMDGAQVRVPEGGSEEDTHSRQAFVPSLVPIPLADYFLISVRGSVEGLDAITTLPMLFGTDKAYLEEMIKECLDVLRDYRIGEESDEAPIYWEGAVRDNRIMILAMELLTRIVATMQDLGGEKYLRILENFESKHKNTTGQRRMERDFCADDVKQLYAMVTSAIARLEALGISRTPKQS